MDPCSLELGTNWSVVSFAPRPPGSQWIGGRVGPRAGLDDMETWTFLTLPGVEPRLLCRGSYSETCIVSCSLERACPSVQSHQTHGDTCPWTRCYKLESQLFTWMFPLSPVITLYSYCLRVSFLSNTESSRETWRSLHYSSSENARFPCRTLH
jgi:hypothetical protein